MPGFRESGIPAFLMALNGIFGKNQKVYFMKQQIQDNVFGQIA